MRLPLLLPLLMLLAAGSGCAGPDPTFVAAERAAFEAVAPEHLNYVRADPTLEPDEVRRKERLIELWDKDIAAQEAEVGKGPVTGG